MAGGSWWTPTIWVDGIDSTWGSYSVSWWLTIFRGMVDARLPVPSPLELDLQVEYGARGDTGTAYVEIVATDTIPFTQLRWYLNIVEDDLTQGVRHYDQILRDYVLGYNGTALTISEGDTVDVSKEFVMDPGWEEEKCRVVVFVQNGKLAPAGERKREVLQAIQGPLLQPVPGQVVDVTITKSSENLLLQWSPVVTDSNGNPIVVDLYRIFRDTVAFFDPGSNPFDSTPETLFMDTTGAVGDTLIHYYYGVTAVSGTKESGLSKGVGEFDRPLTNVEPPETTRVELRLHPSR
jgi:hypothetical protein